MNPERRARKIIRGYKRDPIETFEYLKLGCKMENDFLPGPLRGQGVTALSQRRIDSD